MHGVIRRVAELDPPLFFGSVRVAIPLNDGPVVESHQQRRIVHAPRFGSITSREKFDRSAGAVKRVCQCACYAGSADVIGDVPVHIMFCQPERSPVHGLWHRIGARDRMSPAMPRFGRFRVHEKG